MIIVTKKSISINDKSAVFKKRSSPAFLHYTTMWTKAENRVIRTAKHKKEEDIVLELKKISKFIRKKWNIEDVLIIQRIGKIKAGDVNFFITVSAPQYHETFDSCQHVIKTRGCR